MSWKTGKCFGGLESVLGDWKVVEETGKWLRRLESALEDWKVSWKTGKCLQSMLPKGAMLRSSTCLHCVREIKNPRC